MSKLKMPYGDNTIEISIKFWTDHLPEDSDLKTAHMKGVVYLPLNKSRGIQPAEVKFNNRDEFIPKIFELLEKNGIKLKD
jgi:hypothetical protein